MSAAAKKTVRTGTEKTLKNCGVVIFLGLNDWSPFGTAESAESGGAAAAGDPSPAEEAAGGPRLAAEAGHRQAVQGPTATGTSQARTRS